MYDFLAREWWVFLVRGIAAIVFGLMALAWPGATLVALVVMVGVYFLVDGVAMLIALLSGDEVARHNGWAVGIMGVLSIAAGVLAFAWPNVTALSLLYLVAFWAIAMGVFQMIAAVALRRELEGEFWMGLGGLLSVAFGAYLIAFPGAGLLSLVWLVGFWAIAFGVSSIGLAFRLRALRDAPQATTAATS